MPANLTAAYLSAEQAYKQAQTPQEKIAALEEMFSELPKHKGTEKMQADIRRRLAEARRESQRSKKAGSHGPPAYIVHREGAGQVALLGPPNAGKSQLVASLTHAHTAVADYPFTTRLPVPGMMMFEDVPIQLVDMPAISAEFMEPWMSQVVRSANLRVLVADPNDADVLGEIEFILSTLDSWRIPAPALLLATKQDLDGAEANLLALKELYGERFRFLGVSAITGVGLDEFRRLAFEGLEVVRFYSKPPGKKPDLGVPYVLKRGSTVQDAASHVHRDFAEHLKFARLFGPAHAHEGLMVERGHVVEDGDVLEFHL